MGERKEHLRAASEARCDLNIFAALTAILEGGCVSTQSGRRSAKRIIDICDAERQRQLRAYDDHTARNEDAP